MMISELFTKKRLIALATIVALAVVISFVSSLSQPKPSLVGVSPKDQATNVSLTDPIVYTFVEQNLTASDFSLNSSPNHQWTLSINGNGVIATPQSHLDSEKKYTLTLQWKGQTVSTITLTTQPTQTDYQLIDEIKNEVAQDYPLAAQIPYETNLLRVVYSAPLTLEITLKSPVLSSAQAISQVKAWANSKGGDASVHKYIVIPASPLPSPIS